MNLMKLALPLVLCATGCIPESDYTGDYDMTYDVIMDGAQPDAAGTTVVHVHAGLASEYLLDLGSTFCRIEGLYVAAMTAEDWPYLDIRPQPCWFASSGKTYAMSLAGTATLGKDDNRFAIVLSGTFVDDAKQTHGSATVELGESR